MARYGSSGRRHDLLIKQGCTFTWPFRVSVDGTEDGDPRDISGAEVRAQIRRNAHSEDSYAFNAAVLDGSAGLGVLSMTAEQTAAIASGATPSSRESVYAWDAELALVDGTVVPLAWGYVTVHPEITK